VKKKHISVEGDRVAGVSLHSIEWPASIIIIIIIIKEHF